MENKRASGSNIVSLIFGMAIAFTLLGILVAILSFNSLPQPQPTDPAFTVQSQQPGYDYNQAAATETMHNKAFSIFVAVGFMAFLVIGGIVFIGTLANRRVSQQIAEFDQYAALTKTALQYQQAYAVNKQHIVQANRHNRRALNRHD